MPKRPADGWTSASVSRGHAEEVAELGGPGEGRGIEQKGAAGVGRVGGVGAAAGATGEVPQHPGVDGAEGEVRIVGSEGQVAVTKQPGRLRGAEVRIEDEAGGGTHEREVARLGELGAQRRGAPVLPDDGAVQRLPGRAVEGHERLALVRDAEGGDPVAPLGQAGAELGQGVADGVPDLTGVVLDPAGPGEVLGQLRVGEVGDPGLLVDREGAHPGRARIDGDDDPGHAQPRVVLAGIRRPGGGFGRAWRANNRERPVTCTNGARIGLTRA